MDVGVTTSPSLLVVVPMWLARVMVSLLFWPMAGSTICPALPFLIAANCSAVNFITLGGLGNVIGVGWGLGETEYLELEFRVTILVTLG